MGKRFNARTETFEEIMLFGKPALFTCIRINRDTVPKGLHMYEVRHDDDGIGDPVQIAKGILVNHWGTVITHETIKLDNDGYRDINPDKDWSYGTGDCTTVDDFTKKYPPKTKDYER